MNSILLYESDSDNGDSEPHAKRQKCDAERECLNLSPNENCGVNLTHDCGSDSTNFDYFGVTNDESSSEDEHVIEFGNSEKTLKNETVAPESTFWNDKNEDNWCEPANIWKACATRMPEYGLGDNISKSVSYAKLQSGELNTNVRGYSSKKDKNIVQQSSTLKDKNDDKQSNRAICSTKSPFYIHYKIGPLLNGSKSNFRYPKNKQNENTLMNSVINKIKWSTPQYSHLLAVASSEKLINIWQCLDDHLQLVRSLSSHTKAIKDVSWSKNGKTILSCSYDKTACITDVETGSLITHCDHSNFVTAVQFHPIDSNNFVTGSKDELLCWDKRNTSRPALIFKYKDTFGQVQDLSFNRDGSEIFTCNDLVSRDSSDRNIMAWDFRKGVVVSNQIYQERFTCTRLKVHPSESEFYAQSQGDYIAIFSTNRPYKMSKVKRFEGHSVSGYNVGFDLSPDGKFMVSGSSSGKVPVYDVHRAKCIQHLNMGPNSVCVDVAWHPVLPGTIAAAMYDGRIAIWQ